MEIVTLIIVTSKNRFLGERSKYRFKMYKEGNVEREREREREREKIIYRKFIRDCNANTGFNRDTKISLLRD